MNPAEVALKEVDNFEKIANIASQYGPFFFAVLFILFVPVVGQKWFSKALEKRSVGSEQERQKALEIYSFYWLSGVKTGIVLVGVSIVWWAFVQIKYTLPDADSKFRQKVSDEISRRIFQGVIRGANDDDIFIYDFNNPQYSIYVYPQKNQTPMLIRYVVVFSDDPPKNFPVQLMYMNRKTYEALVSTNTGYVPIALSFCIENDARDISIIKDPATPPHFSFSC